MGLKMSVGRRWRQECQRSCPFPRTRRLIQSIFMEPLSWQQRKSSSQRITYLLAAASLVWLGMATWLVVVAVSPPSSKHYIHNVRPSPLQTKDDKVLDDLGSGRRLCA